MKQFKYDIHVHTSETSKCGMIPGKELVRMYKKAGYRGVVITDHYYAGFFKRLRGKSWDEKIDLYLKGYNNASEEGKKQGVHVIPGIEITFPENFNDYLVYGIDEDFLKVNRELYRLGLKDFRKLIEGSGILLVQAHPFRPFMIPANPLLLDGIEVYNGNPRHNANNHLSLAYAQKHRLKMLSGSDFHQEEDLARGGIIVSEEISTPAGLVDVIRNDRIDELIRK